MSDKRPDERDIDEILASIDEMLSQKQPYTLQDNGRKDSVKEGVKASEDTLGLSSSVDLPELSEFDQVDIDAFLSLGMPEHQHETQSKADKNNEKEPVKKEHNEDERQAKGFNTEAQAKTETPPETNIQADTDIAHDIDQDAVPDMEQNIDENIDFTLDEIDLPEFDETLAINQGANTDEQNTQTPEISDKDAMALSPEESQQVASANTDDVLHDGMIEDNLDEEALDEPNLSENDLGKNSLDEINLDENILDETELLHDEHQDDELTTEDNMPRHRILLTEELLEPSAQEALPLWIEQTSNEEETLEQSDDTADKYETAASETPESAFTAAEPTPTKELHSNASQTVSIKTDALESNSLETEDFNEKEAEVDTKTQGTETKQTPQQPANDVDMQPNTANADVPADKSLSLSATPVSADETTHLHKDDALISDLEEGIGLDTVYKLETLTSDTEDDLDNHTELVEVMMEEVLQDDEEQAENSENKPEKVTEKKVFLNDDELQHMMQAVSADVAQQINDHLQTWLPGLISIAIKNHIKDLNNKD
ncbi:hypothetical protein [Ghiorsea bivora]|uniref:hypothetical protein n=1 Tax=Ghiorsea bivora TaxID=1485545 RepID=UPI00056EB19B|nr:hypothetical protein [Ghiorsea bivora]